MKKTVEMFFVMVLMAVVLYGCVSTGRPVRDAVDTSYNAVQGADQWIRKNLW